MIKRKLYPRLDDEMATIGFRLPVSILNEIERRATSQVRSKSDVARQLIVAALRQEGVIASEAAMKEPRP